MGFHSDIHSGPMYKYLAQISVAEWVCVALHACCSWMIFLGNQCPLAYGCVSFAFLGGTIVNSSSSFELAHLIPAISEMNKRG